MAMNTRKWSDPGFELVALVVNGEIEPNPKYQAYLLAQSAKSDPAVRELIRRASQRKSIRGGQS